MLENELITLIIETIEAGLEAREIEANVVQAAQPTNQGVESGAMVYIHKVPGKKKYGHPARNDVWIADPEPPEDPYMSHSETQWYEARFQCSTLLIEDPSATDGATQMTAADLAVAVSEILSSDATIDTLRESDVGILRIMDIVEPIFTDDKDRNEYSPSFDFTVTFENVTLSTTPAVESTEADVKRV